MQKSSPFSRARSMMSAISAILSMGLGAMATQASISNLGAYESRGKGGKRPHRSTGTAAARRAASKRQNVMRNRRNQR